MDFNIFKSSLKTKMGVPNNHDVDTIAQTLTDAYDRSNVGITKTMYGSTVISGNKTNMQYLIKSGLNLNKITKSKSGYKLIASGFSAYWIGSKFTPIPMPPATVSTLGTQVVIPGNPLDLEKLLNAAFNQKNFDDFATILYNSLTKFHQTISGTFIGLLTATPPVPIILPWVSLGISDTSDESNIVPKSDYSFSIFSPSNAVVDIGIPKITEVSGKKIQTGFMLHDIPGWKNRNFKWSFANLTLYEPSGKATGVFVKNGKIANPETGYPYYTMLSETTGGSFTRYVTLAIMKNNTIRLYETTNELTAEKQIIRDLENIKYAFSGTDVLIRNGGEIEKNTIRKLKPDENRPKTSIGFDNTNNLMVAVTTAKTSQDWEKWGNTLRKINPNATWVSMDGGGSSTLVVKGIPKQVAENIPNGRKVATIIGWYDV